MLIFIHFLNVDFYANIDKTTKTKEKSHKPNELESKNANFTEKMDAKNLTQKQRLLLYAASKGAMSQNAVEREMGLSQGTLSHHKENVPKKTMLTFKKAFPSINLTWLETGDGDIEVEKPIDFSTQNSTTTNVENSTLQEATTYTTTKDLLAAKDELIAQLKDTIAAKDEIIAILREQIKLLKGE